MKNIIFIAPPAAGKGTQSALLEDTYGYNHISTGDLLRNAINNGSEIGNQVKDIMEKGELVSDSIITSLLKEAFNNIKGNFILDGYPRNINQANTLDNIFNELNINDVIVIYLNLNEADACNRALGRIVCKNCGLSYNKYIELLKPLNEGVCDKCHGELIQRTDDNEISFKNRFQTYLNETNPLLEYYKQKDMLKIVEANTSSDEIFEEIKQILTGERSNG